MTGRTKEQKIAFVKQLLENALDAWDRQQEEMLFNPNFKVEQPYPTDESHKMVPSGIPGTMSWEGYYCKDCWAREGTVEANQICRGKHENK